MERLPTCFSLSIPLSTSSGSKHCFTGASDVSCRRTGRLVYSTPVRRRSGRIETVLSVGQGFGGGGGGDSSKWVDSYRAYVRRNGESLCAMAWEGYKRLGRGAVFANYDAAPTNVAVATPGGDGGDGVKMGATTPSFYISHDQLVEKNDSTTVPQMGPILRRIGTYDPYKQFVVVFECNGTQGADIVTPNQDPEAVWRRTRENANA